MDYVGAIDQGTSGTRFMIFDRSGRAVASHYEEHRQSYPLPGWVEHDPMEIWERTQSVIQHAMAQAGLHGEDLAAIGVTNQRETSILWERSTGRPVYPAIVWQDTRTRQLCERLIRDGLDDVISTLTGLRIATYFSATKIAWILENVAGVRADAERGQVLFGTVDSWIIWWLTGGPNGGVHLTDCTNASRTMLMNLRTLEWDQQLLDLFRIPRAMLPEIRPSSDSRTYGMTRAIFDPPVAVCGDLGDQQAALFGQACFSAGEAKNTYGTGNFLLLNNGTQPVVSKAGLLATVAYRLNNEQCYYALEGSIAVTGAAVQWLRDNLGIIASAAETEAIAREVDDTGGCYFVPAFSGLFAPYWDMSARGVIVGLTRYVDRRHVVRATLESVCYQTVDVAEVMEQESGVRLETLKVDGGMVANDFLMQLQADILGIEVVRPTVSETTALGAAYAAGLAAGFWEGLEDLRRHWQVDRTWQPRWSDDQRTSGRRQWRKAVERARSWQ